MTYDVATGRGMRILDLFSGAGGAAMGLHQAFPEAEIVGVDIRSQPRYPFEFAQMDWHEYLTLHTMRFDFAWASPPCERYSQCTPKKFRANHADLIAPVRNSLETWKKPFVIENVPSAAVLLREPIMLCGSMFGLKIRRHRFFEIHGFALLTPTCAHIKSPVLITGTHRRTYEPRYEYSVQQCRDASGLDWMTRAEMDKAIPPAYSRYIGEQFKLSLLSAAAPAGSIGKEKEIL